MKWLLRLVMRIISLFRPKPRRRMCFSGVVQVPASVDPASEIRRDRLVLVGTEDRPKWLRFQCPCGCGDVIALCLMVSHSPHWTVQLHEDGTATVVPSVDSKRCGSHFWIRQNRVAWV
jgi:hypothetical protein